jgi:hypothetical protein
VRRSRRRCSPGPDRLRPGRAEASSDQPFKLDDACRLGSKAFGRCAAAGAAAATDRDRGPWESTRCSGGACAAGRMAKDSLAGPRFDEASDTPIFMSTFDWNIVNKKNNIAAAAAAAAAGPTESASPPLARPD